MREKGLPLCVQVGARGASSRPAITTAHLDSSGHQIFNTPSDICRPPTIVRNAEDGSVSSEHETVVSQLLGVEKLS